MNIRRMTEENEKKILSSKAVLSSQTRGRSHEEPLCEIRTEFQRDRDRIIHSKAFRRLKHKTQVFISPEGDHYRTRLTHTLEVSQVARTIARALRLNEDLAEAIALGHDLGHTPFGHAGEECLNKIHPGGFKHNEQSLRVVEVLELGRGLNLTHEVKDGILTHTGERLPSTLEGQIIRFADRVAYINHDIDDAIRANILTVNDLPRNPLIVLGDTHKKRIDTMVKDLIYTSMGKDNICMSSEVYEAMEELRSFMFEKVYIGSKAKTEESKTENIIKGLYEHFLNNPGSLPVEHTQRIERDGINRVVCDYIAGMTDRFAISSYADIYIPASWAKY